MSAEEGLAARVHVEMLLEILPQVEAPLAYGATEGFDRFVRVAVASKRVLGGVGFGATFHKALVRLNRHCRKIIKNKHLS